MIVPSDGSERTDVTEEVIERAEGASVNSVGVSGLDVIFPRDVSVSVGVPGRDVAGECPLRGRSTPPRPSAEGVSVGVSGRDVTRESCRDVALPRDVSVSVGV